jgi:hypothetical protein
MYNIRHLNLNLVLVQWAAESEAAASPLPITRTDTSRLIRFLFWSNLNMQSTPTSAACWRCHSSSLNPAASIGSSEAHSGAYVSAVVLLSPAMDVSTCTPATTTPTRPTAPSAYQ